MAKKIDFVRTGLLGFTVMSDYNSQGEISGRTLSKTYCIEKKGCYIISIRINKDNEQVAEGFYKLQINGGVVTGIITVDSLPEDVMDNVKDDLKKLNSAEPLTLLDVSDLQQTENAESIT